MKSTLKTVGPKIGSAHRAVGILAVIAFIITGQYMRRTETIYLDETTRMLFRSTHIYILMSGLINFCLGLNHTVNPKSIFSAGQVLGSLPILASPGFFLAGFFIEPTLTGLARPYSTPATYGLFAGALLYLIAWAFLARKD